MRSLSTLGRSKGFVSEASPTRRRLSASFLEFFEGVELLALDSDFDLGEGGSWGVKGLFGDGKSTLRKRCCTASIVGRRVFTL